MAERWLLYIDESGGFEEGQLDPLVLGVLAPGVESPAFVKTLREKLAQIFPGVPYPPHATELNLAAARPWYAMSERPRTPLDPAVAAARDFLQRSEHRDARALHRALRDRQDASWEQLSRASDLLAREASATHKSLTHLHLGQRARLRAFCSEGLAVVAAIAPRQLDAATDRITPPTLCKDRYVATMAALLDRVVALLRPQGHERVEVHMRIAGRHIHEDSFGDRVHLAPRHVRAVAGVVSAGARVTFFLPADYPEARVEPFDTNVHPGIVLADHLSNSLRDHLKAAKGRPWDTVVQQCRDELRIDLTVAAPAFASAPMPGLAAAGSAREFIEGAIPSLTEHAEPRRWARDQAALWRAANHLREQS
jgi:hypothetical protein